MSSKTKILLIVFLLLVPLSVFAQADLEVDYINGPPGDSLPEYVQYIFNFSFGLAGLLAFLMLIYAGFQYISSAGSPDKLKDAKKRMLGSFLGLLIVISSYALLLTINPDILMLIMPQLEDIEIISYPSKLEEIRHSLLGTIKEIGYVGNLLFEEIIDSSDFIAGSILECNCFNAKSLCLCDGGEEDSSCDPGICYVGTDDDGHPCKNYDKIKEEKESLVFRFRELVYYQNRAVGSRFLKNSITGDSILDNIQDNIFEWLEDFDFDSFEGFLTGAANLGGEAMRLQEEIDEILTPKLEYYEAVLAGQTDQRTIEDLNDTINQIEEEISFKEDLRDELIIFSLIVEFLKSPIDDLASLPEQCAPDTQTKCKPACYGECHDTYIGCRSQCIIDTDYNPCPWFEIGIVYMEIGLVKDELGDSLEEIMKLVNEIRKLKGDTS